MLFNSILFLVFFAIVYFVYWSLRGRFRQYFLTFASILFYAAWGLQREGLMGVRWTFHFIGIVWLNYYLIRGMQNFPARRRLLITLIIVLDVLNLGAFKYFGFFRDMIAATGAHLPDSVQSLDIFLPLAISFYTFQLVAYAVDVYRGVIDERPGIFRFTLFILFFPHQIAGPIMRSTDFIPQLDHPVMDRRRMYDGLWLLIGGLAKKVLLADPMGIILAPVYREPQTFTAWSILAGGMCFSLQVYCDFSGYTDMARGCAYLLGYHIPENFRAPFFSASARELWQRWHITLATWLRDYIYFPLGGNRLGQVRTYINLFITFTLGGFWHGADYTYIAWGGMWGALLAVERLIEDKLGWRTTPEKFGVLKSIKIFIMFVFFSIGALMFRTLPVKYPDRQYSSGHIMTEIFAGLVTNGPGEARSDFIRAGGDAVQSELVFGPSVFRLNEITPIDTILFMFVGLFLFHLLQYRPEMLEKYRKYDPWLLLAASAILGGLLLPAIAVGGHQFIYFVF